MPSPCEHPLAIRRIYVAHNIAVQVYGRKQPAAQSIRATLKQKDQSETTDETNKFKGRDNALPYCFWRIADKPDGTVNLLARTCSAAPLHFSLII